MQPLQRGVISESKFRLTPFRLAASMTSKTNKYFIPRGSFLGGGGVELKPGNGSQRPSSR